MMFGGRRRAVDLRGKDPAGCGLDSNVVVRECAVHDSDCELETAGAFGEPAARFFHEGFEQT